VTKKYLVHTEDTSAQENAISWADSHLDATEFKSRDAVDIFIAENSDYIATSDESAREYPVVQQLHVDIISLLVLRDTRDY
jgi:hypothetical protein